MALDQAALKELRELDPDGSSGVLAHIINTYLDESPTLIQHINAALATNDSATFMREAHSLKASSMSLGATDVANIARDLETAGKNNAITSCHAQVAALAAAYAATEPLLRAEMTASGKST
jgi:HPt (histidine-containing phosphotransfer) domain-containing protein